MVYTIYKNLHFSLPRFTAIRRKPETITYACKVLPNFAYKFEDWEQRGSDQWDWSKLLGVSFHWFTNHKNSAMVGIRYNPRTERVELVPYYHINGSKGIYPPTPLARTKTNEFFFIQKIINYTNKTYQLKILTQGKLTHSDPQPFTHNRKWTRGINFWFGGNRTAPQKIQVDLKPINNLPPFDFMSKKTGHEHQKLFAKCKALF